MSWSWIVGLFLSLMVGSPGMVSADSTPPTTGTYGAGQVEATQVDLEPYAELRDPSIFGANWHVSANIGQVPIQGTGLFLTVYYFSDDSGNRVNIQIIPYGDLVAGGRDAVPYARSVVEAIQESLYLAPDVRSSKSATGVFGMDGCASTFRADGQEWATGYPVGVTGCDDEFNERVVVVSVSGYLDLADGPTSGLAASDYVVEAVVSLDSARTPSAGYLIQNASGR